MKFHYIASAKNGKIVEGNEEANSTAEILSVLASRGLRPVSIKAAKKAQPLSSGKHFFAQKISLSDKIFLTKYLAIMLKVGTDLFQAINILISDFEKPSLRALLIEIRETLERGQPFYSTFAKYPKFFSPVFINLVRAGESSGNLDQVFENLNASLEKEKVLRSKVRGALVYPLILITLSVFILIFLTSFALPRLSKVFEGGGFEPPLFSRVVFGVGDFVNTYIWAFLLFILIFGLGVFLFSRTAKGKSVFRSLFIKLPIIKKVSYHLAIQRFASTLSSLLKAGVPILEALRVTAQAVGHPVISNSLLRITNDGIAQGLSMGEAFRKETAFPFVVVNLIAISEKAGHLDEILETLGRFYETEIDSSIKTSITFIEPILLLFIGGMIGLVALAIIVPVYQLVGQI